MKHLPIISLFLVSSVFAVPEDSKPVIRDYSSGLTFFDRIGELRLQNVIYSSPRIRFICYGEGDAPNSSTTLNFSIETNKFQQLQDLKMEEWDTIQKHAQELYRINAMPGDKERGYTYAYTGTKILEQDWARFGKVLILTGWQDLPKVANRFPSGKKYNLHVLAIKGDQCFFVTLSKNEEVKIDDKLVGYILDLVKGKQRN